MESHAVRSAHVAARTALRLGLTAPESEGTDNIRVEIHAKGVAS